MIGFLLLAVLAANLQLPSVRADTVGARRTPAPTDTGAVASRATTPPVIDGRDDDPVWQTAPVISAFTQWQPTEGKPPRFRTEAKVAYDAANLYVFVRAPVAPSSVATPRSSA